MGSGLRAGCAMTLEELAGVVEAHAAALSAARAAGDARALAAFRARVGGATWGQLASVLRIPRSTVVELVRRGERLAGGTVPGPVVTPPVAPSPPPPPAMAPLDTPAPAPAPPASRCLRAGCSTPAGAGHHLCATHQ